jgi:hypothetical protein
VKNKSSGRKSAVARENLRVRIPSDYGWKVLDNIVDDLSYLLNHDETTKIKGIIRSRIHADYLSLSEEWSPRCMALEDIPLAEFRAKYQIGSLLKKFRLPTDNTARRLAAGKKFLDAEAKCSDFNHKGYESLVFTEDDDMHDAFKHACSFLQKLLGTKLPGSEALTKWSRHGPGANLDTKSGAVSSYFKYKDWPYSCTQDALEAARLAIQSDERWIGALEDSYRERYDIPKHAILDQTTFWNTVINIVPGNRIAFVPKDSRTDRPIAIEPALNLYLQLGVDGYIRRRLKRWGVDLDNQEKNRELARRGSLNWEDPESFITLDLAAASDSISTRLCALMLPSEWYSYLMKLRSPQGELGGGSISYEKISSMGNGFTFALESAIFTAVIYGVTRVSRDRFDRDKCAIFGDDIIVTKDVASPVITLLNLCGFSLNLEKSFIEGPFRESCGADWFKGKPVRPVFFTTPPSSVMELWNDINRLKRTFSLRFMEEDAKVVSYMARWIPDDFRQISGPCSDETFDSYLHSSYPTGKYSQSVWKWKCLVVRPKPLSGRSFLFRKLMNDLRGSPFLQACYVSFHDTWRGCKVSGAGSRFTVTKPFSVTVGYSHSVSDIWRSEYLDIAPIWPVPNRR